MATRSMKPGRISLPYERESWSYISPLLIEIQQCKTLTEAFQLLTRIYSASTHESHLGFAQTPYAGLAIFFDKWATAEELQSFLTESLPAIAYFAQRGEYWQPKHGLYYCTAQVKASITLQRQFVASLVALGFLCLLPVELEENRTCLNFATFLQPMYYASRIPAQTSKLRFVLNYFRRLHKMEYEIPGFVTYRRVVQRSPLKKRELCESEAALCPVTVDTKQRIEDSGCRSLQMDFANQYIGGGVLGGGNVQEEIRFSVCPELLASMLFMERMHDNEAIIMQGFEQFSEYAEYGNRLQFACDLQDPSERDASGDILTTLSAIDAIPYHWRSCDQYHVHNVLRDINKAYVGFLQPYLQAYSELQLVNQRVKGWKPTKVEINAVQPDTVTTKGKSKPQGRCEGDKPKMSPGISVNEKTSPGAEKSVVAVEKRPVATGNWGCGAFGGNPQLKSMVQWIAASVACCPQMIYYTFEHTEVTDLGHVAQYILQEKWTVGKLFQKIDQFCVKKVKEGIKQDLFEFLLQKESVL